MSVTLFNILQDPISTLVGICIGLTGLVLSICIFRKQTKQNKTLEDITQTIDRHILGFLPDTQKFTQRLEEALSAAENDESSHVYAMAYWTWFGLDDQIDKILNTNSDNHALSSNPVISSNIGKLLHHRIIKNLHTELALIGGNDKAHNVLKDFCRALVGFRYRELFKHRKVCAPSIDLDGHAADIVAAYQSDLQKLEKSANLQSNVKITQVDNISAIIFVIESRQSSALYFTGELEMLKSFAKVGGFISSNQPMVDVLKSQVQMKLK